MQYLKCPHKVKDWNRLQIIGYVIYEIGYILVFEYNFSIQACPNNTKPQIVVA